MALLLFEVILPKSVNGVVQNILSTVLSVLYKCANEHLTCSPCRKRFFCFLRQHKQSLSYFRNSDYLPQYLHRLILLSLTFQICVFTILFNEFQFIVSIQKWIDLSRNDVATFSIFFPISLVQNGVKVWILHEKIDKYRKYQINSTLGGGSYRQLKLNFIIKCSSKRGRNMVSKKLWRISP